MVDISRKRPARSLTEEVTERIPQGPFEVIGEGNLTGAVNYYGVAFVNGLIPLDGLEVGYSIESHSIDKRENKDVHTFKINAANKDVAKYLAKTRSAPSNIDYLLSDVNVKSVDKETERSTFTTWDVVTERYKESSDGESDSTGGELV